MAGRVFENRWWTVLATLLAGTVGVGTVLVFVTGVFMTTVGEELHFARGTFSTATGLANIVMAIASPFLGRLIDRYGLRIVMLPAIAGFAVATASLSLLTSSLVVLMVLFALQGLFSCVQAPTGYSKMITARFNENRGLALGIALSGQGIGTILVPQFANYLLNHFGWRVGYQGIGVLVIILAFIPVALLFAEPEAMKQARLTARVKGGGGDNALLPGLTFAEGVRLPKFWCMTFAVFLLLCVTNGTLVHIVPMMKDRGIPMEQAVAAVSISGAAMIVGRVVSGYLLDKIYAIHIFYVFLLVPMVGAGILITGAAGWWPIVAVVCMGLALGAEVDLMPFIVSRYFGIRAYGAMYGLALTFVALANAGGMLLMGWCYQLKGTYVPMLMAFEGFLVVAIVLISRMGAYRYPAPKNKPVELYAGKAQAR